MAGRDALTGSRIRERRTIAGQKQADLARRVGISASYLNLIEHNRRRIGGKLLLDIAAALEVEPQTITEGAEAALIAGLREAGEVASLDKIEADRAEEFAGRFPGWAQTLASAHRRVGSLERMVESLSDRVAHDPQLAASLHEVLSTAAAIRATASILAETPELEAPQRERFHENMHQDSRRLSESAKTLVDFLEADPDSTGAVTAQEEVEAWMIQRSFAFPELEEGDADLDALVADASLRTEAARRMARALLGRLFDDAKRVPLTDLRRVLASAGFDPARLSVELGVPVSLILRRLALLPEEQVGLVVADRTGSLTFRKHVAGFETQRFGSACTLWPLFDVLSQPGMLVRTHLTQLGQGQSVFETYAIAEPVTAPEYNTFPLYEATMLLRAQPPAKTESFREVGVTCRICPRAQCPGRREPSILSAGTEGAL